MSLLRFLHTRLGLLLWTAAMITCGSCASTYGHDQHAAASLKSSAVNQEARRGNHGAIKWSSI
jgi:hypothetical protein